MPLWPEQGTDHDEVDWEAYKRRTSSPSSLPQEEQEQPRDSEELVKVPPRRVSRPSEV